MIDLTPDEEALIAAGARREAVEAYHDDACELQHCEREACGRAYRGPALYCSMTCALADAGEFDAALGSDRGGGRMSNVDRAQ